MTDLFLDFGSNIIEFSNAIRQYGSEAAQALGEVRRQLAEGLSTGTGEPVVFKGLQAEVTTTQEKISALKEQIRGIYNAPEVKSSILAGLSRELIGINEQISITQRRIQGISTAGGAGFGGAVTGALADLNRDLSATVTRAETLKATQPTAAAQAAAVAPAAAAAAAPEVDQARISALSASLVAAFELPLQQVRTDFQLLVGALDGVGFQATRTASHLDAVALALKAIQTVKVTPPQAPTAQEESLSRYEQAKRALGGVLSPLEKARAALGGFETPVQESQDATRQFEAQLDSLTAVLRTQVTPSVETSVVALEALAKAIKAFSEIPAPAAPTRPMTQAERLAQAERELGFGFGPSSRFGFQPPSAGPGIGRVAQPVTMQTPYQIMVSTGGAGGVGGPGGVQPIRFIPTGPDPVAQYADKKTKDLEALVQKLRLQIARAVVQPATPELEQKISELRETVNLVEDIVTKRINDALARTRRVTESIAGQGTAGVAGDPELEALLTLSDQRISAKIKRILAERDRIWNLPETAAGQIRVAELEAQKAVLHATRLERMAPGVPAPEATAADRADAEVERERLERARMATAALGTLNQEYEAEIQNIKGVADATDRMQAALALAQRVISERGLTTLTERTAAVRQVGQAAFGGSPAEIRGLQDMALVAGRAAEQESKLLSAQERALITIQHVSEELHRLAIQAQNAATSEEKLAQATELATRLAEVPGIRAQKGIGLAAAAVGLSPEEKAAFAGQAPGTVAAALLRQRTQQRAEDAATRQAQAQQLAVEQQQAAIRARGLQGMTTTPAAATGMRAYVEGYIAKFSQDTQDAIRLAITSFQEAPKDPATEMMIAEAYEHMLRDPLAAARQQTATQLRTGLGTVLRVGGAAPVGGDVAAQLRLVMEQVQQIQSPMLEGARTTGQQWAAAMFQGITPAAREAIDRARQIMSEGLGTPEAAAAAQQAAKMVIMDPYVTTARRTAAAVREALATVLATPEEGKQIGLASIISRANSDAKAALAEHEILIKQYQREIGQAVAAGSAAITAVPRGQRTAVGAQVQAVKDAIAAAKTEQRGLGTPTIGLTVTEQAARAQAAANAATKAVTQAMATLEAAQRKLGAQMGGGGGRIPPGGGVGFAGAGGTGPERFIQEVGKMTEIFGTRALAAPLVFGVQAKLSEAFQEAIATQMEYVRVADALQAANEDSAKTMGDLQSVALSTGQSLEEVTKTASQLVGVFKTPTSLVDATKVVSELTVISNGALDAGEAIRVMGSIIRTFGLDSENGLKQLEDMAVAIQNVVGVNIEDTLEGMARIAPIAKTFGITIQETAALVATTARATGQTGQAASEQLSRVFSALSSGKGRTLLEQSTQGLGAGAVKATDDLGTAIIKVTKAWDTMSQAQQRTLANVAGQRQFAVTTALFSSGSIAAEALAAAEDSAGASARRMSTYMGTVGAQFKVFQQNLVSLIQNLAGSGLLDWFALLIEVVNKLLTAFNHVFGVVDSWLNQNDLTRAIKAVTFDVIGLALALKLLGSVFGQFKTGFTGRIFGRIGAQAREEAGAAAEAAGTARAARTAGGAAGTGATRIVTAGGGVMQTLAAYPVLTPYRVGLEKAGEIAKKFGGTADQGANLFARSMNRVAGVSESFATRLGNIQMRGAGLTTTPEGQVVRTRGPVSSALGSLGTQAGIAIAVAGIVELVQSWSEYNNHVKELNEEIAKASIEAGPARTGGPSVEDLSAAMKEQGKKIAELRKAGVEASTDFTGTDAVMDTALQVADRKSGEAREQGMKTASEIYQILSEGLTAGFIDPTVSDRAAQAPNVKAAAEKAKQEQAGFIQSSFQKMGSALLTGVFTVPLLGNPPSAEGRAEGPGRQMDAMLQSTKRRITAIQNTNETAAKKQKDIQTAIQWYIDQSGAQIDSITAPWWDPEGQQRSKDAQNQLRTSLEEGKNALNAWKTATVAGVTQLNEYSKLSADAASAVDTAISSLSGVSTTVKRLNPEIVKSIIRDIPELGDAGLSDLMEAYASGTASTADQLIVQAQSLQQRILGIANNPNLDPTTRQQELASLLQSLTSTTQSIGQEVVDNALFTAEALETKGNTSGAVKVLNAAIGDLLIQLSKTTQGTAEYRTLVGQIQSLETKIAEVTGRKDATGKPDTTGFTTSLSAVYSASISSLESDLQTVKAIAAAGGDYDTQLTALLATLTGLVQFKGVADRPDVKALFDQAIGIMMGNFTTLVNSFNAGNASAEEVQTQVDKIISSITTYANAGGRISPDIGKQISQIFNTYYVGRIRTLMADAAGGDAGAKAELKTTIDSLTAQLNALSAAGIGGEDLANVEETLLGFLRTSMTNEVNSMIEVIHGLMYTGKNMRALQASSVASLTQALTKLEAIAQYPGESMAHLEWRMTVAFDQISLQFAQDVFAMAKGDKDRAEAKDAMQKASDILIRDIASQPSFTAPKTPAAGGKAAAVPSTPKIPSTTQTAQDRQAAVDAAQQQADEIAKAREAYEEALIKDPIAKIQKQINDNLAAQARARRKGKKGLADLYGLMTQEIQLRQQLADAMAEQAKSIKDIAIAQAEAKGDVVTAAKLRLSEAQDAYNKAVKDFGAGSAQANQAKAGVISSQAAVRDAMLQSQLDTLDFEREINQITAEQEIKALEQILLQTNLTEQQRRDLIRKINGLKDEVEQQFNLGSIMMPTVYSVRRFMQAANTGVDFLGQMAMRTGVAGMAAGGGAVNNNDNRTVNIFINGGDLAAVQDAVASAAGAPATTGTREHKF